MSRVSLVIHGAGLLSVYSLYGLLQEKIIKTTYGKFELAKDILSTTK